MGIGQEVKIRGGFIEDSLGVGEEISFWVKAEYPISLELFFPDSNYNFSPFEFAGKTYFPTEVRSSIAFDSAVYQLQSFEIESIQYMSIPVFLMDNGDTTVLSTRKDSIYFREMVEIASDTTSLKSNTRYFEVARRFNTPLLFVFVGILVLAIIAGYLIFGNRIKRTLKLRRLKKDYIRFSEEFSRTIQELKMSPNFTKAEVGVKSWRAYMEKLENRPYRKLTTKEILELKNTGELDEPLHAIDRFVYGKVDDADIVKRFYALEDFTQHHYSLTIDALKDGR